MYDYLCVGAGLFNAAFARAMADAGKRVLVIDRRDHAGGHCHSRNLDGIHVNLFGAHILHTSDEAVWCFLSRFATLERYTHTLKARYGGRLYSFPPNLNTFQELWGVTDPREARARVDAARLRIDEPRTLEEHFLSQVGEEIYEKFFRHYTAKQWGRPPASLPASIGRRVPVRFSFNDDYFASDRFQGVPAEGYGAMFERMLEGIDLELGADYLRDRSYWRGKARRVVYSGMIDEYFEYSLGPLAYRSLAFETVRHETADWQGSAVVNYTDLSTPCTRAVEYKHFRRGTDLPYTYVALETPREWSRGEDAFYPVPSDARGAPRYDQYLRLAEREEDVYFKGRLGEYVYRDMCPTVQAALAFASTMLAR